MGKVVTGLIIVVGIWVGVEVVTLGPSRAFDGLFAGLFSEGEARPAESRSTAQRAGAAAERARDATVARRERMLGE